MATAPAGDRSPLSPADLALFRELWSSFASESVAKLLPSDLRGNRHTPWDSLGEVLQRRLALAYYARTAPGWVRR